MHRRGDRPGQVKDVPGLPQPASPRAGTASLNGLFNPTWSTLFSAHLLEAFPGCLPGADLQLSPGRRKL